MNGVVGHQRCEGGNLVMHFDIVAVIQLHVADAAAEMLEVPVAPFRLRIVCECMRNRVEGFVGGCW